MNSRRRFFVETGQTFTDLLREISRLVRYFGSRVDVGQFFKFRKRQIGDNGSPLVKQFIEMTVEQHPPVPRRAVAGGALGADGRRAIVGERVIPINEIVQFVHPTQIVEEQFPALPRRHLQAIEANLLALTIVGPQPDHVTFIADDVSQLKLAEESSQRRVGLALLHARLYGKTNVIAVRETKADDRVGDVRRTPGDEIQIHRAQLVEIKCLVVVMHVIVRLRAIVAITDVMNGDLVAGDLGIRQNRHVRQPVTIVRWLQCKPPSDDNYETASGDNQLPRTPNQNPHCQHSHPINRCERKPQPRNSYIKIKRRCCPERRHSEENPNQTDPEAAQEFFALDHAGFVRFRFWFIWFGRPMTVRPAQRSNISIRYAPKSSRWTQPSSTFVRGREKVRMLVSSVSTSITVSTGSTPSTSERPVTSDTAMTSGMVSPMDASTEPSRMLTERWRRLASAARMAAMDSGVNTSNAMMNPPSAGGAPSLITMASSGAAICLASRTSGSP